MKSHHHQQGFIQFLPLIIIGVIVIVSVGAGFVLYKQGEVQAPTFNQEAAELKAEISALQSEVTELKKENKETQKEQGAVVIFHN